MSRLGLIILLLALFVQSPVGAQDRQTALARLKKMNVAFTGDDFILSIIAGDKAKVELFLAAGMSPNTIMTRQELEIGDRYFSYGQTALLFALSYEYDDIALLLLARGADVNQKGPNDVFPLMLAKGRLVKELIDRGADVNQKGFDGQTALMCAADDLEKLALLLEHGANVNAKTQDGESVLRMAASSPQAVKLLIEHGADVSEFSERAIRVMTSEPRPDDQVMKLMARLSTTEVGHVITGPSAEAQAEVPEQLLKLAGKSAESRAMVIERLIDVVESPAAQDEVLMAHAWMTAVEVLGKLRATEAIDALVENLNRTGQNGIVLSIHIKPVSRALERIGEPAVPKLIEALSHPKPTIKWEAAWVLFSIDKDKAKAALESACQTEKDEKIRQVFKDVIQRIEQGY